MFVNGDLKGKFIMDRNLGARDSGYASDGKGNIQYQYGRKDPFAGNIFETSVTTAYKGRGGDNDIWELEGENVESIGGTTISTAINNPMIMYNRDVENHSWCQAVNSESISWHDYEVSVESNEKSIFDPSPKGWKVAHKDTWTGFSNFAMANWYQDGAVIGRIYPAGDNPFAYYPIHGYRSANTTDLSMVLCVIWSSTPSSTTWSYHIYLHASVFVNGGGGRGQTNNVRCVQHNE